MIYHQFFFLFNMSDLETSEHKDTNTGLNADLVKGFELISKLGNRDPNEE